MERLAKFYIMFCSGNTSISSQSSACSVVLAWFYGLYCGVDEKTFHLLPASTVTVLTGAPYVWIRKSVLILFWMPENK